jgi:transcriptional regulator with XRE-family HTH domain
MKISSHIKELRKALGWTQTELANKAGLAYAQVGRYENKKSVPTIEVLVKLANALNTTTDYLINGATGEQASQHIKDIELLHLFSSVDELEQEDKNIVKVFLDALVTKRKLQKIA